MTSELSAFAARLRESIRADFPPEQFPDLALELFALQFQHNAPYRRICEARRVTPLTVSHWANIPPVPTAAFKELDLTCLPPEARTHVFHSSGTTSQRPSRHCHNPESLALYEASLWPWFARHLGPGLRFGIADLRLTLLAPPPAQAPHSSLVHMFETVRRELGAPPSAFVGHTGNDSAWTINFETTLRALQDPRPKTQDSGLKIQDSRLQTQDARSETPDSGLKTQDSGLKIQDPGLKTQDSRLILGTAFSFIHLLDWLADQNLRLQLPVGSRVMETGGYKGRSRALSKIEFHALITDRLGVPPSHIVCEYGMSELSSQAYAQTSEAHHLSLVTHHFSFPPWSRAQIISPETGREVAEGETGLLRVFDLANVFSVLAVQTEDLAIRHGDGFELLGRAALAEPRGCSLLAV